MKKYLFSELIEEITELNTELLYGLDDIVGVTIEKGLIPTIANLTKTELNKFYIVKPDTFVFNPRTHGVRLGMGYNDTENTYITSWNNVAFKVKDEARTLLNPEYLWLYFNRTEWDRETNYHAWGSSTIVFSWNTFRNLSIKLPEKEVQDKIVRQYKVIKNRIKLKKQINDNLFATANAFFTEKFSHFLHEDMRNMPNYVQLKNFVKIKHGYAFDGEQFSETKTSKILVSPGNFKIGGGFQNNKPKFYNEKAEYKTDYILEPGSLVVTMTDLSKNGDTLGFPAIIPNDKQITFLHNQRVGLVELVNNIYPKAFIYFLMCSNDYRNYILATASGTTVRHTSPDKILGYGFLAPDNKSDLMLLNRLYEVYLSDCDTLNIEIQRLTELQATLLSKMVY